MDHFRKNLKGSELQRRKKSSNKVVETDENEFRFLHNGAPTMSKTAGVKKNTLFSKTSLKKKILAERNEEPLQDSSPSSYLEITPQSKGISCANLCEGSFQNTPISSHSYDPIINYTSPRPKFLRYNPNQRRELLKRIEGEKMGKEEVQPESFLSTPNSLSEMGNDNDYEEEKEEEEEEEEFEEKAYSSFVVWSLVFLFGVSLFISYSMGRSSYPSFEGNESYADDIQSKAHRRLVGKSLFSLSFLGSLMSSSQMCPVRRESFCNPEENLFGSELFDRTEVLVAEVHDLLLKNGGMVDDDSVDQNGGDFGPLAEGNANKSITTIETLIKENNITSSSVESSLVSVVQVVSDTLFTVKEDKFYNESLDSTELSSISQSRFLNLEDLSFSSASETELKSDFSSSILSEVLLTFFVFLGSLTIVIASLSYFHKYFRRVKFNSLHVVAPSPPSSEFCRKTETGEEMITEVSMKEENLDKALDMSVESKTSGLNSVSSTSDYKSVELKKVSGFERPRVELLGELSLMDARVTTDNGFGSNLIKMEYSNSQFSYNQNGKARKMLSPLPNMLDSSPEKSTSSTNRFSSKVPWNRCEVSDSSTTSSLRRSSRLQSRNRVIMS